jgi:uncharacterized protein (DUF433 family)
MKHASTSSFETVPLGVGYYTVPEAARLLKLPPRSINRWLGGYRYREGAEERWLPPLWAPELPALGDRLEIGFRDLIELRFVKAFIEAGLMLKTVRHCLAYARECVQDPRPFSTRRFKTDGRTIFLEGLRTAADGELLDLKKRQYVLKETIEQTFKDLDIQDAVVARWRPFHGKESIVIDPERAFGKPIVTVYGVPTVALADAVAAEGSIHRVAYLYEVPGTVVRDAVNFEEYLLAA